MVKKAKKKSEPSIFSLLIESLDSMKLTPSKKEFARAVLRAAVEYAAMRQAGFILKKDKVSL